MDERIRKHGNSAAIIHYNMDMIGADRQDLQNSFFPFNRKTWYRWYKNIYPLHLTDYAEFAFIIKEIFREKKMSFMILDIRSCAVFYRYGWKKPKRSQEQMG